MEKVAGLPGTSPTVPPEAEERALMSAYAAGDERAFAALFRLLAPRLLSFFRRSIADQALADDLLQATFVRIHGARTRYRPELPLRPWVFTIAARVRIDELRRRHRLPPFASEEELDRLEAQRELEHTHTASETDAQLQRLRAALAALTPAQRMIVHLHRFEELSFAEIGRVLGVSEGAARVRAFRAYARLREQLLPAPTESSP
jgi:RNA polymerase sigma-70 factor (ECF subfamily)